MSSRPWYHKQLIYNYIMYHGTNHTNIWDGHAEHSYVQLT